MYNISLYKERITDSFNNKSTVIKLKSDNVECEDMVYKVVGRLFADWDI